MTMLRRRTDERTVERNPAGAAGLAGRHFRKMNGLGNDFVVLDAREVPLVVSSEAATAIADRRQGIGCDQVIVLERAADADAFMRIINADGGEVEACGNATRCVAHLLLEEHGREWTTIRTAADLLQARRGDAPLSVAVDMGRPALGWADIPLAGAPPEREDTRVIAIDGGALGLPSQFSAVSMGNPHAIFFVENPEAHDLSAIGPILEHHPLFPERANISLVKVVSRNALRQRVWERGAGLTLACGTGACAASVAAIRAGLCDPRVSVTLPGGVLEIEWQPDGHVLMTGPVAYEFEGNLADALAGS